MNKDKFMLRCPLCYGEFQFGPHRYDGTTIPRYQITVCNSCYQGNWDGWAPHYEKQLIEHLDFRTFQAKAFLISAIRN